MLHSSALLRRRLATYSRRQITVLQRRLNGNKSKRLMSTRVDARNENQSPAVGIAQAVGLAPLAILGTGVAATYASEGVRDALDERFPKIMASARKVLPGLPPPKAAEPVYDPTTSKRQLDDTIILPPAHADVSDLRTDPLVNASSDHVQEESVPSEKGAEGAAQTEEADVQSPVQVDGDAVANSAGDDGDKVGNGLVDDDDNADKLLADASDEAADASSNRTEGDQVGNGLADDGDKVGNGLVSDGDQVGDGQVENDDVDGEQGTSSDSSDDVEVADKGENHIGDNDSSSVQSSDEEAEHDVEDADDNDKSDSQGTNVEEEADKVEEEEIAEQKEAENSHSQDLLALDYIEPTPRAKDGESEPSSTDSGNGEGGIDVDSEIEKIDGRAARRSYEAVANILQSDDALNHDLDAVGDLNNVEALKQRIRMLQRQHIARSKHEATRLHEMLRQQKAELDEEYQQLIDDRIHELQRQHRSELSSLDNETELELRAESERLRQRYEDKIRAAAKQFGRVSRQKMEQELAERTELIQREALAQHEKRLTAIQALRVEVAAIEKIAAYHRHYDTVSRHTHQRSAMAFKLQTLMESGRPLGKILAEVTESLDEERDALLVAAVGAIPELAREKGVPTTMELQRQFIERKDSAVAASMAPAEGGAVARGLAYVFSQFLIAPDRKAMETGDFMDGEAPTAYERLEHAHCLLNQGDLHGSAAQINLLLGEHDDSAVVYILGEWLEAARARCIVSQAIQIIQAQAGAAADALS